MHLSTSLFYVHGCNPSPRDAEQPQYSTPQLQQPVLSILPNSKDHYQVLIHSIQPTKSSGPTDQYPQTFRWLACKDWVNSVESKLITAVILSCSAAAVSCLTIPSIYKQHSRNIRQLRIQKGASGAPQSAYRSNSSAKEQNRDLESSILPLLVELIRQIAKHCGGNHENNVGHSGTSGAPKPSRTRNPQLPEKFPGRPSVLELEEHHGSRAQS